MPGQSDFPDASRTEKELMTHWPSYHPGIGRVFDALTRSQPKLTWQALTLRPGGESDEYNMDMANLQAHNQGITALNSIQNPELKAFAETWRKAQLPADEIADPGDAVELYQHWALGPDMPLFCKIAHRIAAAEPYMRT